MLFNINTYYYLIKTKMSINLTEYFTENEMKLMNIFFSNSNTSKLFSELLLKEGKNYNLNDPKLSKNIFGNIIYETIYMRVKDNNDEIILRREIELILHYKFTELRDRQEINLILDDLCPKLVEFIKK